MSAHRRQRGDTVGADTSALQADLATALLKLVSAQRLFARRDSSSLPECFEDGKKNPDNPEWAKRPTKNVIELLAAHLVEDAFEEIATATSNVTTHFEYCLRILSKNVRSLTVDEEQPFKNFDIDRNLPVSSVLPLTPAAAGAAATDDIAPPPNTTTRTVAGECAALSAVLEVFTRQRGTIFDQVRTLASAADALARSLPSGGRDATTAIIENVFVAQRSRDPKPTVIPDRHVEPPCGIQDDVAEAHLKDLTQPTSRIQLSVLGGESGAGKTIAGLLLASRKVGNEHCCGVYFNGMELPTDDELRKASTSKAQSGRVKPEQTTAREKAVHDELVDKKVIELVSALFPGRCRPVFSIVSPDAKPEPTIPTGDRELVIIFDEMGSQLVALRALCSVAYSLHVLLSGCLGVPVRLLAIGAGCADRYVYGAGTEPPTFRTSVLKPGPTLWGHCEDNLFPSPLPRPSPTFDTRLQKLVENSRFAALLGRALSTLKHGVAMWDKKHTSLTDAVPGLVRACLLQFVQLNGLFYFDTPEATVLLALSHVVTGTKTVTAKHWDLCAVKTGLLLDTAFWTDKVNPEEHEPVDADADCVPPVADNDKCGRTLVIFTNRPRFHMSEAAVAMLLEGFGECCRDRLVSGQVAGNFFEAEAGDCVALLARLVTLPADLHPATSLRPSAQTSLFKLMSQLPRGGRVSEVTLKTRGLNTFLGAVREAIAEVAKKGGSFAKGEVLVVRNGSVSPFADIIVMSCKRLILIQVKNLAQCASQVEAELLKMGWYALLDILRKRAAKNAATKKAASAADAEKAARDSLDTVSQLVNLCRKDAASRLGRFPVDVLLLCNHRDDEPVPTLRDVSEKYTPDDESFEMSRHYIDVSEGGLHPVAQVCDKRAPNQTTAPVLRHPEWNGEAAAATRGSKPTGAKS